MTNLFSGDPFGDPPELGDDIEARTRRRIRMLRARRRITVIGFGAGVLVLVLAAALVLGSGAKRPETQRTIDDAPVSTTSTSPPRGSTGPTESPSTTQDRPTKSTKATTRARSSNRATPSGAGTTNHGPSVDTHARPPETSSGSHGTTVAATAPVTTTDELSCPSGGTVTYTVTLDARLVDAGAHTWMVTGTVAITNHTGATVASMGWVDPIDATWVGTDTPFSIGWQGTDGPPATPDGGNTWVAVPAHSTRQVALDTSMGVVDGANVHSIDRPTSFSDGGLFASWYHPDDLCEGLTNDPNYTITSGVPSLP